MANMERKKHKSMISIEKQKLQEKETIANGNQVNLDVHPDANNLVDAQGTKFPRIFRRLFA